MPTCSVATNSLNSPRGPYVHRIFKARSGLPFPTPGTLPDPGIEPASPALAGGFFTTEPPGKPPLIHISLFLVSPSQPQTWFMGTSANISD